MLLTIDVGNTNIFLGLYDKNKLVTYYKIKTRKGFDIEDALRKVVPIKNITGVAICSVVQPLKEKFERWSKENSKLNPVIVNPELDLGIKLDYKNKKELGCDRIANAVAAYNLYKKGCIIIDLGTAITFDVVSPEGIYWGGAITPGMSTSAKALFDNADLLYPVSLGKKDFIIGRSTTESLQIGIIHGFASMLEGMTEKLKEKIKFTPLVILTGGDAENMTNVIKCNHIINPFLTLEGLRIIYERNAHKKPNKK